MKTAFEILTKNHCGLKMFANGQLDTHSEYQEEQILKSMQEYGKQCFEAGQEIDTIPWDWIRKYKDYNEYLNQTK